METSSQTTGEAAPLSSAVATALRHGNTIEAIKIVRKERNFGLKEAKNAIEGYLANQPALRASFDAAQTEEPANKERRIRHHYDEIMEILVHGDASNFLTLQAAEPSFPHGRDSFLDRHWITNAIHFEAETAIRWMVAQGVNLSYCDNEGLTSLSEVLDCKDAELRYAMLHLLLKAGARHDVVGYNVFTAAHFAAVRNDVKALRILKEYGADLCAATLDFSWRTPEDVARFHKCDDALAYLESICHGCANKLHNQR